MDEIEIIARILAYFAEDGTMTEEAIKFPLEKNSADYFRAAAEQLIEIYNKYSKTSVEREISQEQ